MEQNSQLVFLVIVIIKTEANRSNSGMQDKPGRSSKINFCYFVCKRGVLGVSPNNGYQRLEQVSFEPEIKILPHRENITPSAGDEIKSPELFKEQRSAVLYRKKAGRINNRTLVVAEQGLIGERGVQIIPGAIKSFSKIFLHNQGCPNPRSSLIFHHHIAQQGR